MPVDMIPLELDDAPPPPALPQFPTEPLPAPAIAAAAPVAAEPAAAEAGAPPPGEPPKSRPSTRLASLDAFRGLTIFLMLLVNNIALDTATPRQLMHAEWNGGIHLADLVFPWFLLIMGVAIPFSLASHHRKGLPSWQFDLRVFGRAAGLVLAGCIIDSSLAKHALFSLGVLQLIGLAYLVAALLAELPAQRRLLIAAGFLAMHGAAIRYLPVPGVGVGVFTPQHNVIEHFNRTYLETYHLKGLLSVVPAAAMALIGSVIGQLLMRGKESPHQATAQLLIGGLVLTGAGMLWNLSLPYNKPLWTASYILFTAGLGTLLLALLYLVMDLNGWKRWAAPLVVFGSNAIVAYVVPILVKVHVLQEWRWTLPDGSHLNLQDAAIHAAKTTLGPIAGGWVYTLSYILVWWGLLALLYRKRVFLRL